ncbi:LacI family transcriptional regulator [Lachnospiraceae bacterium ASD3451]|uniref:LacI family DNA-binding transcriptional regulator n=1 Tax=Diplocloster agilis TaxID=2850323 RepID=UPI001E0558EA|nr:LacI family DNA-binding transcriptional regulator [Diplocloster agilis]MBU9745559.1 LacI family transcriptional regulator [Diplocloster agilis]
MKRTTIKDVAGMANVCIATASLALNNKPGVSEHVRKKVLAAAAELQYVPNTNARSLRTNKTKCIGIIVTDLSNPYFSGLVNEICNKAEKINYDTIIVVSNDDIAKEKKCIDLLMARGVDGIIITPPCDENMEKGTSNYYILDDLSIPYVFCTMDLATVNGYSVMCDLDEGEYQLISHLLERGCKKISMITTPFSYRPSLLRYQGYKRAHEEAGIPVDTGNLHFIPYPNYADGYAITDEVWATRPDAIVTINDFVAMAVLKRLYEQKVRVPIDVSVAGYDDLLLCEQLVVPLTTVRQPLGDLAGASLEILMRLMNNEPSEKKIILNSVLKVRSTTR